jgi:NADPH-dependent 2,4-dienoyl-CoA reductase/sulfur reductase-like enzyme
MIATGASPLRLPFAAGLENVHELRTLADARALRDALRDAERVAVIGAGFIGQEVAAAARALGLAVTLADALDAPLAPLLGDRVGGWLAELHRANGVELSLGSAVRGLTGSRRATEVALEDGRRIACDAVVVGIGVRPTTGWLAGTPLAERDGIRVDAAGRTSIPGVLAAGDVALRYDEAARCHRRTEHWESAVLEGRAAAAAMLGAEPPPQPPPAFWSDLHGVRVQWVGDASGSDDLAIERGPDASQLAARYLRAGHTVGALLAGRPGDLPAMRRDVADGLAALASSGAGSAPVDGVDPVRPRPSRPSATRPDELVPAVARTAPTEPSPREPSRDEGGST